MANPCTWTYSGDEFSTWDTTCGQALIMSDELAAMSIHRDKPVELVTLTELPEKPEGWTKHLAVHMNYGEKGGAATYTIRDDQGRQTNIGYAYDTRKSKGAPKGEAGFFVNGSELMTWPELRRRYAELTQQ